MSRIFERSLSAAAVVAASAAPLFAQTTYAWWRPRQVPEIDASTGVLAVAALIAVLAFVAERRRRRSA